MKVVILLGAPGSGKGTTAEKIRDAAGALHVATGDMLREAVKRGTDVGLEAESYMKKGELVPDEIIIKLVEARLEKEGTEKTYLFDGFPRTLNQAELLEKALASRGGSVSKVVFLDAPREVLIERLTGRRTCRKCGANFHVKNIPPKQEGVCDFCGGELYQRPDDKEDTIVKRLEVYAEQTRDLIAHYERKNLLERVDSSRRADQLAADVLRMMEALD